MKIFAKLSFCFLMAVSCISLGCSETEKKMESDKPAAESSETPAADASGSDSKEG
jgi:hypothetical protein